VPHAPTAIAVGHDFYVEWAVERGCDLRVDGFARVAPERFALIGELGPIDGLLALRTSRDIEYTETHQWQDWGAMRPLVDHWLAEDRPIFLTVVALPPSPWPDVVFDPVDEVSGIWRLRFLR